MCSVHRARMSLKVFSVLRVEDAISMRIAFTTFVGQPYTYLRFICITPLLARSGYRPFLNEESMIFPPRCSHSRWWDLTSVRFPFTTIPCVLEDGRGVHLRSRWLSPCLIRFVVLSRGFTLHLILPSSYYFDLRIYECFQFVLRSCRHFHHIYVAT